MDKSIVLNSIIDQTLSHPNQLQVRNWNNIINELKTQANINARYLMELDNLLFGTGSNTSSLFPYRPLYGKNSTVINENADINDITYLYVNSYVCGTDNAAASLSNCPTKLAFIMEVSTQSVTNSDPSTGTWIYRVRRIYTRIGEEYVQEVRKTPSTNGIVYEAWKKIVTSAKLTETLEDYAKKDELPTKTSELENDSGFLTEHQDLSNYATKNELPTKVSELDNDSGYLTELPTNLNASTIYSENIGSKWLEFYTGDYLKKVTRIGLSGALGQVVLSGGLTPVWDNGTETKRLATLDDLASVSSLDIQVVTELPTADISSTTIYLKKVGDTEQNLYEEYIYVDRKWELIGTTQVDLSNYATINDIPTKVSQLENDSGYLTKVPANVTLSSIKLRSAMGGITSNAIVYSVTSVPGSFDNETINYIAISDDVSVGGDVEALSVTTSKIVSPSQPSWNNGKISKTLATLDDIRDLSFRVEIYNELPTENISSKIIYLIPVDNLAEPNVYEEYIYVNNKWELIGTTKVDLSDYAKKTELPTKVSELENDSNYLTNSTGDERYLKLSKVINANDANKHLSDSDVLSVGGLNTYLSDKNYATKQDITNLVNSAPETLDTLGELATAFNENKNVVEALDDAISNKADKTELPTKTSQLTNDSGFITLDDIPTSGGEFPKEPEFDNVTINENGNIIFKNHDQGIIFEQCDAEPVIYLDSGDDSVVIGASTKIQGSLNVDTGVIIRNPEEPYEETHLQDFGLSSAYSGSPEDGSTNLSIGYFELNTDFANSFIHLVPEEWRASFQFGDKLIELNNSGITHSSDGENFYTLTLPNKSGTLATLDDISSGGGSAEFPKEPEFKSVTVSSTDEPFVKVVNKDDDTTYTKLSPFYVDLYYGDTNVYLSAEEVGLYMYGSGISSGYRWDSVSLSSGNQDEPSAVLMLGGLELEDPLSQSYIHLYAEEARAEFKFQDDYIQLDSDGIHLTHFEDQGTFVDINRECIYLERYGSYIDISPEANAITIHDDNTGNNISISPDHINHNKNDVNYTLSLPEKSGTLATTDDIQNAPVSQKFNITCEHALEYTGYGQGDCNVAVNDQQMLVTKIQGQTKRKSPNLFDQDKILPTVGFTKQSDGSFYKKTSATDGTNTIWKNPYFSLSRIVLRVDMLNSATYGVGFYIYYTDGTNDFAYITHPLDGTYKAFTYTTNANKKVSYIDILSVDYGAKVYWKNFSIVSYGESNTYYQHYDNVLQNSQNNLISTGLQLWDEHWEQGGLDETTGTSDDTYPSIRSKNFIQVIPSTTYYLSNNGRVLYYDINKIFISAGASGAFTTPANCYYLKFRLSTDYGTIYQNDIMLNYGSSSIAYKQYKQDKLYCDIALGQWDYIDNISNRLIRQTSNIITFNGSESWTKSTTTYNYVTRFDLEYDMTNYARETNNRGIGVCNKAEWTNASLFGVLDDFYVCPNSGGTKFYVLIPYSSEITTLEQFKNWLAEENLQFVYKLATPIESDVYLSSGMAVYKGGMQLQDEDVPYIVSKEYVVSLKDQALANIEMDRTQQLKINELYNRIESGGTGGGLVSEDRINELIAAYMSANYENGNTGAY